MNIEPDISKGNTTYFITTDTYEKDSCAYCLSRVVNGVLDVILIKSMRDEDQFKEEVNNLSNYFDCKIYDEQTKSFKGSKKTPKKQQVIDLKQWDGFDEVSSKALQNIDTETRFYEQLKKLFVAPVLPKEIIWK